MYYLVDGALNKSLGTKVKRHAQALLDQYHAGKYGLGPKLTIGEYYQRWIQTKTLGLYRTHTVSDYKQHFSGYLLSEFGSTSMAKLTVSQLSEFRSKLLDRGLSVKTCRNLLDASFRALWRDAMAEGIVTSNPFALLRWPRMPGHKPDPFTAYERDRILGWWKEHDFFFYPYVYFQFHTGLRPSETAGLTWSDINIETGRIMIRRSLVQGEENATKTAGAERIIRVDNSVLDLLKALPSRQLGIQSVFVGKRGNPMSKKWSEHNWKMSLEKCGIRHRKFYTTRHTFITEALKRGEYAFAVAQYTGTSPAMLQRDYCGTLGLSVLSPLADTSQESQMNQGIERVAGPGFEPGDVLFDDVQERLTIELLKLGKKAING